jgi:phytanoyl-CoA hydroxylase
MLSKQQIRAYRQNGFIVLPNFFAGEVILEVLEDISNLLNNSRNVHTHDKTFDLYPDHSADVPKVRRIKQPHAVSKIVREVLKDEKLRGVICQLLGPDVRIRSSKVNLKRASDGPAIEWHQDWAYCPHTNDDLLAISVMLDPCTLHNGPLQIIPGTHLEKIFDHHSEGIFCGGIDATLLRNHADKAVSCIGDQGTIVVHHVRSVHGSAANRSLQSRRLLIFELVSADAWPLMGVQDLNEYNNRMLFGNPVTVPRMCAVPVRIPLPKPVHQGSIFENQRTMANRSFD